MNVYRVWVDEDDWTWDEYDSMVVIAESEDQARAMEPAVRTDVRGLGNGMVQPERIRVQLIGRAAPGQDCGVVVASFNAG